MTDWIVKYREMVSRQPTGDACWFQDLLKKQRAGDEMAGRLIVGSRLPLALQLAEEGAPDVPTERVEEANAGLVDALHSFAGSTAEEFDCHAEAAVRRRLEALQPA